MQDQFEFAAQLAVRTIASLSFTAPLFAGDTLSPTTLVSHTPAGISGNNWSPDCAVSHDGRFITFYSEASDLVPGDANGVDDVFLKDMQNGTLELISLSASGGPSDGPSWLSSISADGRYVCFDSITTNLVTPAVINYSETYVRDRQTGLTELVSVNDSGAQANNWTVLSRISADGRYVAFSSLADNLVPGDISDGFFDVFVRDRVANTTVCVSRGPGGIQANASSWRPTFSADGRFVAFSSQASNLVAGGTTPGRQHIYLRDAVGGAVTLMSATVGGVEGNANSYDPALSGDGRFVAFETHATNLLPPPHNGMTEIVLRAVASGAVERGNLNAQGDTIQAPSRRASLSHDGRFLGFQASPYVVPDQAGPVLVRDRVLATTFAVCSRDDGASPQTSVGVQNLVLSGDGTTIAYSVNASLLAVDVNGVSDVYVRGVGAPATYCAAKFNSLGCPPAIGFSGAARVSNGYALTVSCTNVLNQKLGLLIHGLNGPQKILFQQAFLCVRGPFARSIATSSGGNAAPANDCSGAWSLNLGTVLAASPIGFQVGAGSVLDLQWWGRDPGITPPNNTQLSNALQIVVAP